MVTRSHPTKTPPASGETLPDAKLTIKVGDKEVHLEARPDIVRQELDRVVDRLFSGDRAMVAASTGGDPAHRDPVVVSVTAPGELAGAAEPPPAPSPEPAAAPSVSPPSPSPAAPAAQSALDFVTRVRGRQALQRGAADLLAHTTLDPAGFTALYSVDPRGKVQLQTPPRTTTPIDDTLLLVLYGALTLRGVATLGGLPLLRAVRSLGFRVERVPRKFGLATGHVQSFARLRSKRYRLTASGIRHCEGLIPGLVKAVRG